MLRTLFAVILLLAAASLISAPPPVLAQTPPTGTGAVVTHDSKHDLSPVMRTLPARPPGPIETPKLKPGKLPPMQGPATDSPAPLKVVPPAGGPTPKTALSTSLYWGGQSDACSCDTAEVNGDVGPVQYVQAVNGAYAVYNKNDTGLLLSPRALTTLFNGFGGACESNGQGAPIVLYDHLADRWFIAYNAYLGPANPPYHACVAISQTPDATGAFYRYDFVVSTRELNWLPKYGLWPDGYYGEYQDYPDVGGGPDGQSAVVMDRVKMLQGLPATMQTFALPDATTGMLPSDLDGTPPPAGTPNTYLSLGSPSMLRYDFHVDWLNPANSTFGVGAFHTPTQTITVDPWVLPQSLAQQPAPGALLDPLAGQAMPRLQYRNSGTRETLVWSYEIADDLILTPTVDVYERTPLTSGRFQLARSASMVFDASNARWNSSAAMDRSGNVAVAYSRSGPAVNPTISFSGFSPTSSLFSEGNGPAGGGVQTNYSEWGPYSSLSADPVNDCEFWYTGEYYISTSDTGWVTVIFNFFIPGCGATATCPCSLFGDSATPGTPAVADGGSYELGVRFVPDSAGYISAIKFYKGTGNNGTHIGHLWTDGGVILASAAFTGETATGWQTATISPAIPVTPGQTYVASYGAPLGHFAGEGGFFNSIWYRGPLHAPAGPPNGLYAVGAGSFPGNAAPGNANYFVDIVMSPGPTVPAACPCSIFGPVDQPANPAVADGGSYELGMKFIADQKGFVTGVRFYKGSGNLGTHTGHLWTGGSLLSSVVFSSESASGWQTATFPAPIAIMANVPYVISYGAPAGHFAADANYFNGSKDTPPLHALAGPTSFGNGVFAGGAGSFPGNAAPGNSNYWVDVVFSLNGPAQTVCPCSLTDGNATPNSTIVLDGNSYELGTKFYADEGGYVSGVRFYKGAGNAGTHTGHLWTTSGTLLASVTFSGETSTGWQQATFASPVGITPGVTYIVSYGAPAGHFSRDPNFFTNSGIDRGPLHAPTSPAAGGNGVVGAGAGSFPNFAASQDAFFYVDLVFSRLPVVPAPNDNIASPTIIGTLPYDVSEDVSTATLAAGDPAMVVGGTCVAIPGNGGRGSRSVWFRFTPSSTQTYAFSTDNTSYDTVVMAFTGSPGALTQVGCDDDSGPGNTSRLSLNLNAGTPYYIEVINFTTAPTGVGTLVFHAQVGSLPLMTPMRTGDIESKKG